MKQCSPFFAHYQRRSTNVIALASILIVCALLLPTLFVLLRHSDPMVERSAWGVMYDVFSVAVSLLSIVAGIVALLYFLFAQRCYARCEGGFVIYHRLLWWRWGARELSVDEGTQTVLARYSGAWGIALLRSTLPAWEQILMGSKRRPVYGVSQLSSTSEPTYLYEATRRADALAFLRLLREQGLLSTVEGLDASQLEREPARISRLSAVRWRRGISLFSPKRMRRRRALLQRISLALAEQGRVDQRVMRAASARPLYVSHAEQAWAYGFLWVAICVINLWTLIGSSFAASWQQWLGLPVSAEVLFTAIAFLIYLGFFGYVGFQLLVMQVYDLREGELCRRWQLLCCTWGAEQMAIPDAGALVWRATRGQWLLLRCELLLQREGQPDATLYSSSFLMGWISPELTECRERVMLKLLATRYPRLTVE